MLFRPVPSLAGPAVPRKSDSSWTETSWSPRKMKNVRQRRRGLRRSEERETVMATRDGGRVNHEAALGLVVGIGKDIPYPLDKWENY